MKKFSAFSALIVLLVTPSAFINPTEGSTILDPLNLTKWIANPEQGLNGLVVDKNTGIVYIGVNKWILQFNSSLELMASVENLPHIYGVPDPKCLKCKPSQNQLFVINQDFDELLACTGLQDINSFPLHRTLCTGWNLSNVSISSRSSASISSYAIYNPFAFIAPGPSNGTNTTNVLFVVAAERSDFPNPPFAARSLDPDHNLKLIASWRFEDSDLHLGIPIYGFSYKGFSYFLISTFTKHGSELMRVHQNHSTLASYAQISLHCGGGKYTHKGAITAYIRQPGAKLANQFSVTTDDQLLFALFLSQAGDSTELCIYSMEKVRQLFRNSEQTTKTNRDKRDVNAYVSGPRDDYDGYALVVRSDGYDRDESNDEEENNSILMSQPAFSLNESAYKLAATVSGPSTIVLIGTEQAQVKKLLLTSETTAIEFDDPIEIATGGAVEGLAFDPSEQHLYVATAKEVNKILLSNCTKWTTRRDCLEARDPFCGWYQPLNKCIALHGYQPDFNKPIRHAYGDKKDQNVTISIYVGRQISCCQLIKHRIVPNIENVDATHDACTPSENMNGTVICDLKSLSNLTHESFHPEGSLNFTIQLTLKGDEYFPDVSLNKPVVLFSCSYVSTYEKCITSAFGCRWNRDTRQCVIDPPNPRLSADMTIFEEPLPPKLHQPYILTCKIESEGFGNVWWTKGTSYLNTTVLEQDGIVESMQFSRGSTDAHFHDLRFEVLQTKHFGSYTCHFNEGNSTISRATDVSVNDTWIIEKFYAFAQSPTSVRLSLKKPSSVPDNGFFQVALFQQHGPDNETRLKNLGPVEDTANILDGLEPFTTYSLKLRTCSSYANETVCGQYTNQLSIRTLEWIPSVATNVTCEWVQSTSAILVRWEPPIKPNGRITKYYVELLEFSLHTDYKEVENQIVPVNNTREIEFTNLSSNKTFGVRVRAINRGYLGYKNVELCSTPAEIPDPAALPPTLTILTVLKVVTASQTAVDGSRLLKYHPGEPALLSCGVPENFTSIKVVFEVELSNGSSTSIHAHQILDSDSRQILTFLSISFDGGRLQCHAEAEDPATGTVHFSSSATALEVISDSPTKAHSFKNLNELDPTLLTWCNDSNVCSRGTSDRALDSAENAFGFFEIQMNPPRIEFYSTGNLSLKPHVVRLPETFSKTKLKITIARVRADPSEPQVIWTHSPGGHLWLTNVQTGASAVLKKHFGVVQMDVDWNKHVVFGVSEKDRKCIDKLDLKNTSSVTSICANEAITSIAVGHGYIYYVTGSGKIVQRNRQNGSELEVFSGYPNSVPRSSIARNDGKISWVQHFFDKFSVIYTMQPQGDQKIITRHVVMKLIRGIHEKATKRTSACSDCSHYCKPFGRQPSCGCQWKLAETGNRCSGKWIHALTKSSLVTFDMADTTKVAQTSSLNSAHQIKLISQDGSGPEFCFLNETKAGIHFDCWKATTTDLPIGPGTVLEVLKNSCSAEIDVIFNDGTCIKILHVAKNQTWTLFCGKISSANVVVDTKSWIVFWEQEKSVHLAELPSLVTREFVNKTNFELPAETAGRLALDSGSKTMYWIHSSKVWSRSYEDDAKSAPKLLWKAGTPKKLQFHDGFLYWIESDVGFDEIVIFDIEHGSRQTLIAASAASTRFESFVVQSAAKTGTDCSNCSRLNCSHFCLPPLTEYASPKCWCPNEKPILTSSGRCKEPVLYIVQENATTETDTFDLRKTHGSLRHKPAEITKEAPAGLAVFASNQNVQCWLTGPRNQVECWNSKSNVTKLLGFAHSTNPILSLDFEKKMVIYNTGNETGKYGSFTLANVTNGDKLEFEPIKEDQGSPFAFDHRRKFAVWCTKSELKFHEVGGSHLDSHEVNIETDFCDRVAKSCTSLALDEENGRAYFIHGNQIKRIDYFPKSSNPLVRTLHEFRYSKANSLSFDGKGHLFWTGGFEDFGEFVDMIKIPEKKNVVVSSIQVSSLTKGNIIQVQAEREAATNLTEKAATRNDPCGDSDCEFFCFPKNRWTLKGLKCYCPTKFHPDDRTSSKCEPLYKTLAESKGDETISEAVEKENDDSLLKIIIGACSGAVVLGLVVFGLIIRKRRGNRVEDYKKALTLFLDGDQDSANMIDNPAERSYYVPFSKVIPPEDINLNDAKQLGSGQFGAVFLAKYKEESVAIKVVKHGSDKEQMKEFLKEIKIMAYIGDHAHIVQMYGAEVSNLEKGGVLVVLELCPHGDLETYLRKQNKNFSYVTVDHQVGTNEVDILSHDDQCPTPLNFSNLVDWSRQIAHGLAYLEEKQVVHGDLATRNALLFDNNVVKVSDFGFSRKTYGKQYTKANKQTPLPFRWAAPETLDQMTFSAQTDVWSYGVTVWEIFTLGNCPFAQQSWDLTFSTRLREGMRLEKPELATDEIYDRLMMHCWQINPDDRPTFIQICELWDHLYGKTSQGAFKSSDARYVIR